MLVDVVNRDLPAIWVMAQFAFRTVLSSVQVRMAVLAFLRNIAELEIRVTIDTLHFRVPPAQQKSGLRVLELHLRSQWFPSLIAVTLLARNVELFSVRTAFLRRGILLLRARSCGAKEEEQEERGPKNWQNLKLLKSL